MITTNNKIDHGYIASFGHAPESPYLRDSIKIHMLGKLNEAKQKMEEIKASIDDMEFTSELEQGAIKVTVSGNKRVRDIVIAPALLADREALQDLLIIALNKAADDAEEKAAELMKKAYNDLFPGMGGLLGF